LLEAVRTYFGSVLGPMRGRDGNVHRGRPRDGLFVMISHLGAMISAVNGALIARRFKRITGTVGAACIGEGATSTGAFHEAINQAAVEKLPLVLVVADNQYAYSTPNSLQFACKSLADKAAGYGVEVQSVDGTDLEDCLIKLEHAVARAREGRGPQMVVARLLRLCGHGEHDDASYVDPKLKQSPLGRDCVSVAEEFLCGKAGGSAFDPVVARGSIAPCRGGRGQSAAQPGRIHSRRSGTHFPRGTCTKDTLRLEPSRPAVAS
jgi:pyruvate dehydrogenase E1 component alpha subunit/2-oxoisovalerate dehydrogenase E1 component alpha subunit